MVIGKFAGAALGALFDPWFGILLGAMAGHVLDLAVGRWRSHFIAARDRRRDRRNRRRSIRQADVRARGVNVRTSEEVVDPALRAHLAVLDCCAEDDRETVKARWRRLVAAQHPDRRQAHGKSVDNASAERLAEVQRAWKAVRRARGWR